MKATFPVMPAKRLGYRRKQVNRSMMANSATFVCTTWFSQLQRSALNKNVYQENSALYLPGEDFVQRSGKYKFTIQHIYDPKG